MYIPRTMGRPIPAPKTSPFWRQILAALAALDLAAVGGLLALLLVNRLLVAQLEVYRDNYMASFSAIVDLMDDLLPYLVAYMGTASLLTLATLIVWVCSGSTSGALRTGLIALLVALVLTLGLWTGAGRRVELGDPPPTSPTPTMPLR